MWKEPWHKGGGLGDTPGGAEGGGAATAVGRSGRGGAASSGDGGGGTSTLWQGVSEYTAGCTREQLVVGAALGAVVAYAVFTEGRPMARWTWRRMRQIAKYL